MSGEAVVISVLLTSPVGLAVLAGAGATLAARLVVAWMDEQKIQAQERARQERKTLAQWQSHHAAAQARAAEMADRRDRLRALLDGLSLESPNVSVSAHERPQAEGFVDVAGQSLEEMLSPLLASLPAEVLADPAAPFERLKKQMERRDRQTRAGKVPSPRALEDFRKTVEMTVSQHLDTMDREMAASKMLLEETDSLLGEVMSYRHLASSEVQAEELEALRTNLLKLIAAGEATTGSVSLLGRKFDVLKSAIDRQLQQRGLHEALQTRLRDHLDGLGYRSLQADMGAESTWEIPGGERVRVAIGEDLRLGFQLMHEREEHSGHALSERELAYLRQQEKRWCGDLHELVRLLNEDGFELNIEFEREAPQETIPVVVVDDLNEWAESDEAAGAPKRRELP